MDNVRLTPFFAFIKLISGKLRLPFPLPHHGPAKGLRKEQPIESILAKCRKKYCLLGVPGVDNLSLQRAWVLGLGDPLALRLAHLLMNEFTSAGWVRMIVWPPSSMTASGSTLRQGIKRSRRP